VGEGVDLGSLVARAEAVVDVHDRHTGGAAVEHRQQRREAVEARPITHGCGHRDDRASNEARNHARQGTLHAGDNHEGVRLQQLGKLVEQAVDTGDADVTDDVGIGAGHARGNRSFLRNRQVRRAGADHGDAGEELSLLALDRRDARQFVVGGIRDGGLEGTVAPDIETRDQETARALDEATTDRGDLLRCLALGQDYLWQERAQLAMVVDLREAEVFIGQNAQLIEGGLDTEAAGRNGLQQEPEVLCPELIEGLVNGEYPDEFVGGL